MTNVSEISRPVTPERRARIDAIKANMEVAEREYALRSLLRYLWTATGKDPSIAVRDLFADDDPIVADIEAALDA